MSHSLADKIFSIKEKLTDQEFKEIMEDVGKLNKEEGNQLINCRFMEVSVLETIDESRPAPDFVVFTKHYRPYVRYFSEKRTKSQVAMWGQDHNFPVEEYDRHICDAKGGEIRPQLDVVYHTQLFYLNELSDIFVDSDDEN